MDTKTLALALTFSACALSANADNSSAVSSGYKLEGAPSATEVPARGFGAYKMTTLPPLPEGSVQMTKPGSSWPGQGADMVLPPTRLPAQPSVPSGLALPQGQTAPVTLPSLPAGLGQAPTQGAAADALPARPRLEATFAGRRGFVVAGGRRVSVGDRMPKSKLRLASVSGGRAELSDGTELELGDDIPEGSK